MPIKKSKLTGRLAEFDDAGNFIRFVDDKPAIGKIAPSNEPTAPTIKAAEIPLSGRLMGGILPAVGGMGGSVAGAPGSVAGSMLGSVAQSLLQTQAPGFFGAPPEDPTQQAVWEGIMDRVSAGLFSGGKALYSAGKPTLHRAAQKIFGESKLPDEVAMMAAKEGLQPTMGQVTKSKAANVLEALFAPQQRAERVAAQQNTLRDLYEKAINVGVPQDKVPALINEGIQEGFVRSMGTRDESLKVLKEALSTAEPLVVKEGGAKGVVRDPIFITNTRKLANESLREMEAKFGAGKGPEYLASLPPEVRDTYQLVQDFAQIKPTKFVSEAEDAAHKAAVKKQTSDYAAMQAKYKADKADFDAGRISTAPKPPSKPEPIPAPKSQKAEATISSFQGFMEAAEALERRVEDLGTAAPSKLVEFAASMKNELDRAANSLSPKAREAYNAYKNARDNVKLFYRDLPDISRAVEKDYQHLQNADKLLKDPAAVRTAVQGSADPALTKKLLGSQWLANSFKAAKGENGGLKPNTAIEMFTDPANKQVLDELFSKPEQARLKGLFSTIKELDPKAPFDNSISMAIKGGTAAIALGTGLINVLGGGGIGPSAVRGAATVSLLLGARETVKRVLLDPQVMQKMVAASRYKAKDLPPGLKNGLKTALTGMRVVISTPDGDVDGVINDDGDAVPFQAPRDLRR